MFDRIMATSPFAVVVKAALEEARRRGDRRLGTEHLLLGLLYDPGSEASLALGVDLDHARAALDALDRSALASIGIDPGAFPASPAASAKHPPVKVSALTSNARAVVQRSVKGTTLRTRHTAPRHLLLALLSCGSPDPVAGLLAELHVDGAAVRARLEVDVP